MRGGMVFAAPPPPPFPPLVLTARLGHETIAPADPVTLRPTRRATRLPAAGLVAERSPDGGQLAVFGVRERPGGGDKGFALSFVDRRTWRTRGSLRFGLDADAGRIAWLRDDRLLLAGFLEVRVVDPVTRRVVRKLRAPGSILDAVQAGDRLAVVLAGPPRIALLDAEGAVSFVADLPLPGPARGGGLAVEVDPVTGHLLALGGTAAPTIVDVDPATGAVAARSLPAVAGAAGPFAWHGPRVVLGGAADGRVRSVRWLDEAGTGVTAVRRLARASSVVGEADSVLATRRGRVTAFDPDGARRWSLEVRGYPWATEAAGRTYVFDRRRGATRVLDAATGRRIATVRAPRGRRAILREANGRYLLPQLLARPAP